MARRNVEYIISLRDKFGRSIDKLNSKAFQLDNRMKRLDKSTKGLGSTLTKVFAGVAILAGIKKSISAFEDQEFAIAQVRQGLESTGFAVGKTLKELTKSAKELQEKSIFGDEKILQGVTAQLLTFANITEGVFDRTQQAVLDVTTRLFGAKASAESLRGTSIQLGKALNDPISQLGALSRSGITFSKSQVEVIKKLAETGKLAEAQGVILTELEKQYGGSAEAARNTALGGMKVLQTRFQDLLVIIGEQFIPTFIKLEKGLKSLIGFLTANQNAIQFLVKATIAAVAAFVAYKSVTFLLSAGLRIYVVAVKLSVIATRFFTQGTKSATRAAKLFGLTIKASPIGLIATLLSTAAAAFVFFKDGITDATEELTKFGNKIDEINTKIGRKLFQETVRGLVDPITKTFDPGNLQNLVEKLSQFQKSELESLRLFLEEQENLFTRSLTNAETTVQKSIIKSDLEDITKSLELVNKEFAKFSKGRTIGGITNQQIGITKITSAAPKIFNITIDKLVETVNINSTTVQGGAVRMKEEITTALLTALSDVQIQAR